MKRDLHSIAEREWDLLVIGGGITGAGILRDAAMRGLSAALLEKKDFSSGTSSATSKLAHGGLRYLKTLEFPLVRESLRERRLLSLIAPHGIYPLPFLLPIYKGRSIVQAGMWLYDLLSFDKGRVDDPSKRLPRFKMLSPAEALALEPGLKQEGLKGAALYYDSQNTYPDRICLEFIRDAMARGAAAANYATVTGFVTEHQRVCGVTFRDAEPGGHTYTARAKLCVNAAGPWADLLLKDTPISLPKAIRRSKGIHLVTRPLTHNRALVLESPFDGRIFFVLPWRGFSIVGTTDSTYDGDPDALKVTTADCNRLIEELNLAYPSARLRIEDVLFSYVGIRPLIEDLDKGASTQVSRKHEIYDHEEKDKLAGLLTVMGGKWTTTRELAEETVNLALKRLGLAERPCSTDVPLDVARFGVFSHYLAQEITSWHGEAPRELIRTLIETYGTEYRRIYEQYGRRNSALKSGDAEILPVGHDLYFFGQALHAAKEEMALHLDDFLLRRTGIGTLGDPGRASVEKLAARMGSALNWDHTRQAAEVIRYYDSFSIVE